MKIENAIRKGRRAAQKSFLAEIRELKRAAVRSRGEAHERRDDQSYWRTVGEVDILCSLEATFAVRLGVKL